MDTMSPCEGCLKRANDPQGKYRMKFICGPNGKLLKNAPGNYKCGQVYQQPYHMSKFAFWELLEEEPVLKIPEMSKSDDVFEEEAVFIPDDEEVVVEDSAEIVLSQTAPLLDGVNIDPDSPAIIEPYMTFSQATGTLKEYVPPVESPPVEVSRDELKRILDEAGVEYNQRARTETLRKLVDELDSEE